jgi:YfiH family protein
MTLRAVRVPLDVDWAAPDHVMAFTTLRSEAIDSESVRGRLGRGVRVQRLRQVHGAAAIDASCASGEPDADACFSRSANLACVVVTADCLPLLVCNRAGSEVAAIHAGWRGLQGGVIEATLARMQSAAAELMVWLGPAISQDCFEVGPEVRQGFLAAAVAGTEQTTEQCFQSGRDDRFMADLYQLARIRLACLGVEAVTGGDFCTYSDAGRFHSWRREGEAAGRMASVIAFL